MRADVKKFVKERNEMLKKRDVGELRKFINANPRLYGEAFSRAINEASDAVLEVALHKMIVNVPKLPAKLRRDSAYWLISRGYDLNTL